MKIIRLAAVVALVFATAGCSDFMGGRPLGMPSGPVWGGFDLDCSDISGPVWVGNGDPHALDGDGDGIGCE